MKKFLIILLVLACLLTMCSCGSTPDTLDADTKATTTTTESQTTTTTATAEVKKPEPLDADTEAKIKADYAAFRNAKGGDVAIENVEIDAYYGTYQEGDIALILSAKNEMGISTTFKEMIAGCEFEISMSYPLYIYHNSEFTPLQDAYEAGMVSQEDVKSIHELRGCH